MTTRAKLPALPRVATSDQALNRWITAVAERLEVREGSRGDPGERAVTVRELEGLSASAARSVGADLTAAGISLTPAGLQGNQNFVSLLESAIRKTQLYQHLLRRLDDPERFHTLAAEIRQALQTSIADEALSRGADIRRVESKIQQSDRSLAMVTEELTAAVGSSAAGIRELKATYATETRAQAVKVTQLESSLGNYYQDGTPGRAQLEQTLTTTVDKVDGISAEYMVKVAVGADGKKKVAGFGLSATEDPLGNQDSAFLVLADKFAVVLPDEEITDPKNPPASRIPFGVDENGVFINGSVRINGQPKAIRLTADAYAYNGSTSSPATITITATLLGGLSGTVSFSTTAGTLSGSGDARTLTTSGIGSSGAVVTATVTSGGYTYTDKLAIAYVINGSPGADSTVPGPPGSDSTVPGPRGAAFATSTANSASDSAFIAASGLSSAINGDQLMLTNSSGSTIYTRLNGSWSNTTALKVHGDAVIKGTLSVDKITSGSAVTSDGTFRLGGTSLITNFNSLVQASVGSGIDRGAVGGSSFSVNYPAVYGVNYGSGYGGGFYSFSGSTKVTQFVGGYTTHAALAQHISAGKLVTLANDSYALKSNTGEGKFYAVDGVGPFTGLHDGLTDESPQIGDIMVDHEILKQESISSSVASFRISTQACQKGAIGVCSELFDTPPSGWGPEDASPMQAGYQENPDVPPGMKVIHVNALGEGQINVCGEGGNIQKGDFIVTSSTPGKGMRQDDDIVRSYTVAKARQNVVFSGPEDIKLVACIYLCG